MTEYSVMKVFNHFIVIVHQFILHIHKLPILPYKKLFKPFNVHPVTVFEILDHRV